MSLTLINHRELVYSEIQDQLVEQYNKNLKYFWKENEEQFFGVDLHPALEFVGFQTRDYSQLKLNQISRAGSRNKKYTEIKQNVERNGYKSKYIPPCVMMVPGTSDWIITGNTRIQILLELGITKIVVAVYRPKKGVSKAQIEDAKLHCGQTFNTSHDPASPPSPDDIKRTLDELVKLFKTTNGEAGVDLDLVPLLEKVDQLCGKGVFEPQTRQRIAQEVLNTHNPHEIIVAWQDNKAAEYRLQNYMDLYNFKSNEKVEYFYSSSSSPSKAFCRALELSQQFPHKEIRVIIHTSTLEGYDLERVYENRLSVFYQKFESLKSAALGLTNGKSADRIKVYGAFPALSSIHELNLPVFINSKTRYAYQRNNEKYMSASDYQFELTSDDDSNEKIAA